jgi:hypothetical protein
MIDENNWILQKLLGLMPGEWLQVGSRVFRANPETGAIEIYEWDDARSVWVDSKGREVGPPLSDELSYRFPWNILPPEIRDKVDQSRWAEVNDLFRKLLTGQSLSDAEWARLAELLGMPASIAAALAEMMKDGLSADAAIRLIQAVLGEGISGVEEFFEEIKGLSGTDLFLAILGFILSQAEKLIPGKKVVEVVVRIGWLLAVWGIISALFNSLWAFYYRRDSARAGDLYLAMLPFAFLLAVFLVQFIGASKFSPRDRKLEVDEWLQVLVLFPLIALMLFALAASIVSGGGRR